ncbi:MAG: M56 family metallopeptidase [Thermoguttaceae bacterium]
MPRAQAEGTMQSDLAASYGLWAACMLRLALGAAVIVLAAAWAARWARWSAWQRAVWQAATAGLLLWIALEWVGFGEAAGRWVFLEPRRTGPSAIGPERTEELGPPAPPSLPGVEPPVALQPYQPAWTIGLEGSEPCQPDPPLVWQPAGASSASSGPIRPAVRWPLALTRGWPNAPPGRAPRAVVWPGLVWGLGTLVVLGRIAWARLLLHRLRRPQASALEGGLRGLVDALATRVGMRRRVSAFQHEGLSVPVAFGLLRPTILVPAGFRRDFSPQEQEAVLAHELAHLAAGDPLWQFLAELACAVLWWQPWVWWLRARLRAASEAAADEASLLVPGGPEVLAGCLVALGRRLVSPGPLGWLSFQGSGFRSALGRRVQRLLSLPGHRRGPGRRGLSMVRTAMPVALIVVSVLCTAWVHPQATLAQGETKMSVLSSSWRHSLAAMVLAALWAPAAAEEPKPEDKPPVAEKKEGVKPELKLELRKLEGKPKEIIRRAAAIEPEVRELLIRRAELEKKAQDLQAKLKQAKDRQEGDSPEAHELRAALERTRDEIAEITQRIPEPMRGMKVTVFEKGRVMVFAGPGGIRIPGAEPPKLVGIPPEERERLQQRLEAIEREIGHLKEAGKHDEAERLAREAQEIKQRLVGPRMPPLAPQPPLSPEQRERLQNGLEQLGRVIRELKEAGKHDEAERLAREAQEIKQLLLGPPRPPLAPQPPLPPEEHERRMRHLKIAVENLHMAGLHEQAEHLAREGEAILSGRMPPGFDFRVPGAGVRPPMPPGPPEDATRELREQIRALQRQIDELREQLRRKGEPERR